MSKNKKHIIFDTKSSEIFNEIRSHFSNYNIECVSTDFFCVDPKIILLKDCFEIIKHSDGSVTVKSNLKVEKIKGTDRVIDHEYITKVHGYLLIDSQADNHKDPIRWDRQFIPDGLASSYYNLKKRGIKISPLDINIKKFLQDYFHYNENDWTLKELKVSRTVDLEVDYRKVLFYFFEIE
jgi:hypothetical protein